MLDLIILAIWLMLPAYIANPAAALFGGGTPIDMGKKFADGKRWLGDGKTYRGLLAGTVCGMLIGAAQILLAPAIAPYLSGIVNPDHLMTWTAIAAVTMPFRPAGRHDQSFFKRRIGYDRGAMLPIADQLDSSRRRVLTCQWRQPG
jgi:CDP-2,3-bis-(O-geranylgeranyl)-sn-glycerol synthase